MSKYDREKYLVKLKARVQHSCNECGKSINIGETYYKEKVDMRPPPGLVLKKYCSKCGGQG